MAKIAFVSSMAGSPWGGSEELWSQAASRLNSEKHEVFASVVWWPRLSPRIAVLAKQGIKVAVQQTPPTGLASKLWRKTQQRLGWQNFDFTKLQNQKPDLTVISQGYNRDGLAWMNFCRKVGLPYAAIIQCNAEIWWPNDDDGKQMAQAYQAAQAVFCVSQHNLELLERQIGVRLSNASVVWNPYNVDVNERPAWPSQNVDLKLACVARLDPAAKGQDLLFQLLAQSKWRERQVEVNLYGAGPCEQLLRQLAQTLRLENVHFRGHVDNVADIWVRNQLLVLPSRYEGLPLALVEAMWCGRPAVVTDIGGNAEVCLDEKTGFVAAAPSLALLDKAMERAWMRRSEWPAMGQAARARAENLIPKDPNREFCSILIECLKKSRKQGTQMSQF